jgi:hypothetical protein
MNCAISWDAFALGEWEWVPIAYHVKLTELVARPLRVMIEVATTPAHADRFLDEVTTHLRALTTWDSQHPLSEKILPDGAKEVRRNGYDCYHTFRKITDGIRQEGRYHSGVTPPEMFAAASGLAILLGEWVYRLATPAERIEMGIEDDPVPNALTIDPAIQAEREAVAAIPALVEENRAGFESVLSAIESQIAHNDRHTRAAKLPELKPHDRQAWQLATLYGMTQDKVAAALNKEHGTTYTQGQVSRMITRVKAHAEANGLAEKVAGRIDRPRTVDPVRLELGARVDKRKPRPSDTARADDDDE